MAAALFEVTGFFGVLGVLMTLPEILRTHVYPVYPVIGEVWVGGTPLDSVGFPVQIALICVFFLVSAGELVATRWLWQSERRGGRLGVSLAATGFILSVGFVLPIWLTLHPIKLALLLFNWRALSR